MMRKAKIMEIEEKNGDNIKHLLGKIVTCTVNLYEALNPNSMQ